MSYGTVQAEKMTTESGYSLGAGNASTFKNRIINGAMTIDQRNAGASVTPTSNGQYTLDRWFAGISASSKFSVQQNAGSVTPPAGFKNYLGITSLASTSVGSSDYYQLRTAIEGLNVYDLAWGTANAKSITVSFWVYSSLTGTFSFAVFNSSENRFYPSTYTISSANTWEQKTITIPGDTTGTWLTTNGIGLVLNFSLGLGTNYTTSTANAWTGSAGFGITGATNLVATNGATLYITGVQLEVGTVATSFDFRDYGREQILCYRYYYQDSGGGGSIGYQYHASPGDVNLHYVYKYPVTMRATPTVTVTVSNATGGSQYVGLNSCETYSTAPGTSAESRLNSIILSSEL